MKRILINATHNEEIRVALCKDNHLYDFDLENRTREQKKANIYKGHITRVEPSLEAAFVEYGSARQGFLPLREIASEYLNGNAREDNIKQLIKEGDEVIVQVEKEERGNKGAALSTYISLAGRYLVLMPNNAKAGGISRQISGKVREEMKQIIANLNLPKGMSVIVRTAGLGKGADDLQNDLDHLLDIWKSIQEQNRTRPSPCLVHQEAGVVTRAVRDYLRDDISEVWIDSENAYNEAANFIAAVMPTQMKKLRKYTEYEPMFARFGIERQIETAYQREVRLPSGGSIVIDQTEAMVAIDINSSKSTKGSDVAETAYHTNLEAADEIARQLRLRDMGGLIVIDFIDMADPRHQKDVEKRLIEATKHDRARVQFAEISKFGLMEMSRQRLRPSLEEATGYICPRCHGNGMIRDLRSLSLSIMRQIEQIALKERMGEIQAEVPTDIAAFLLNEKRESLVYLEQDSGARITILPHAHLESPNFSLHFNPDGFAPSSYERIADTEEKQTIDRGYEVNWQNDNDKENHAQHWQKSKSAQPTGDKATEQAKPVANEPQAVAWLSNLFAPKPQAKLAGSLGSQDVASAIESIVNAGGVSLGASGQLNAIATQVQKPSVQEEPRKANKKPKAKKETTFIEEIVPEKKEKDKKESKDKDKEQYAKREAGSRRESRGEVVRQETLTPKAKHEKTEKKAPTEHKTEKAEKAPRQKANTTEVVLHIAQVETPEPTPQVVHLTLDGSKGEITPKANKVKKAEQTAPAKTTKTTEPSQTHTPAPVAVDEQLAEDAPAPSIAPASEETPIQQSSDLQGVQMNDVLVEKLRTIASQTGRASNDPRVVQQALNQPQAITGTAMSFITAQLGQAVTGNFIADFLTAKAISQATTDTLDFSNFGYQALTPEQMAEFDDKIKPAAQTSAPQGKSEAPVRPITRRASNDPRGQHPEYVTAATEVAIDETVSNDSSSTNQPSAIDTEEVAQTQATPSVEELTLLDVAANLIVKADEFIEETKEAMSENLETLTAELSELVAHTNDAKAEADNQPALPSDEHHHDTGNEAQSEAQTDEPNDAPEAVEEKSAKTKGGQIKQIRADQKPEKKSKANSYKDMIENVAGQLQPRVGILNLMTPKSPSKTPKARTRKASKKDNKPKSEVVVKKVAKSESPVDNED